MYFSPSHFNVRRQRQPRKGERTIARTGEAEGKGKIEKRQGKIKRKQKMIQLLT
jgi:hypothetical protein